MLRLQLDQRMRKRLEVTFSIGEERRLWDQNGLDTHVVIAVNAVFQRIYSRGRLSNVINFIIFPSGRMIS